VWFGGAIALAVAVSVVVGLLASLPSEAPDWALNSRAVHRGEVMLAVFAILYAMLTAGFLAFRGRAFTKLSIGGASVEAPEELIEVSANNHDSIVRLGFALSNVLAAQEELSGRVARLESEGRGELPQVVVSPGTEPTPRDPGEGNGHSQLPPGEDDG
jgi:hypothetical protein